MVSACAVARAQVLSFRVVFETIVVTGIVRAVCQLMIAGRNSLVSKTMWMTHVFVAAFEQVAWIGGRSRGVAGGMIEESGEGIAKVLVLM